MIPFNVPLVTGREEEYIKKVLSRRKLSGNNEFTKKCHALMEERFNYKKVLLTTSGTAALEMAAILSGIGVGDEVIMPSFTFVSTANAFALRGARIRFVDIRPDTMNMDENLFEAALTTRTKAVVPVHYAGIGCRMEKVTAAAQKFGLRVVEDAAHSIDSKYQQSHLGSIGDMGCLSFHETKNITCGEGGALIINRDEYFEKAEIIWEKGTDRTKFYRGEVSKYTWIDIGSSFLMNELSAAYLYAQLLQIDQITQSRRNIWSRYHRFLKKLAEANKIGLPVVPAGCEPNGHIFYIKAKDLEERTNLVKFLMNKGIHAVFHYIPLHSSKAGLNFGEFVGLDRWTTRESERLLRLPLWHGLTNSQITYICRSVYEFYHEEFAEEE